MAGIINLAIVIGIVCLGATYVSGQIIQKPLKFDCYGHGNFTYFPGRGDILLNLWEICGGDIGIDQTFEPGFDASTSTLQAKLNCLETKTTAGEPFTDRRDVAIDTTSTTVKEQLKNVLRQMSFELGASIERTDFCTLTVELIDHIQHVTYVSNATEVLLTVPVDPTATLRVEDSMGMTRTMMPTPEYIRVSSVDSMQIEILGQVIGVYVKHMKLPNVPLMIATFLRYRSTFDFELAGSDCNDFGADEDKYPYFNSSDILLNVTTFTGDPNSFTEQQSVNLLETTWTIPDNICGAFNLVFMVDPLFTVFPPINRCDYFKVYPVFIPCPGHMPGEDHVWDHVPFQCEMTQNAFSPGDVFFSTKNVKHNYMWVTDEVNYHYFEREPHGEKTSWKESTRWGDPSHQLKVRGYAWMTLVYKTFEQDYPNLVTDCSMTSFDVQATIKDLDGIGQQPFVGVQEPEFIINYNEWKDRSYAEIQAHLNTEQMNTFFVDFESKITHHIKIGLLKGILKYMKETGMPMTDTSGTLMFDEFNFGGDKTIEERVKSIFTQGYASEEELLALVQNASAKMAQLNSKFGIDATCFGKSFDAIMYLVRESHHGYLHSMSNVDLTMQYMYMDLFEMDNVNEFLQLHGTMLIRNLTRISMNGCIQRIDRMMQADCIDEIAITDLDVDAKSRICIMSRFRDYLKTNIRSLGIPYVVKDVINDRVNEARRGEPGVKFDYPLRVTNGSYNLWVDNWENENQFFNEYEVLPTYTHVCRRKMASCRCETCDHDGSDHMSGDGSDSSGLDSGYSTDGYSDTTTYNPLVKKR